MFELLAAVLLSAQATDVGVNKATRRLFPLANTPQRMLALGLPALTEHIRTIGLFRNKAKNLYETCRLLVERHGGEVPRIARGARSAARRRAARPPTWCSTWPSASRPWRSTRTSSASANRTGLAPGRNPLEVETRLLERVPPAYRVDAHHWLILHGRYVCQARQPRCAECAVARLLRLRVLPTSDPCIQGGTCKVLQCPGRAVRNRIGHARCQRHPGDLRPPRSRRESTATSSSSNSPAPSPT